jgi:hypothetical protein
VELIRVVDLPDTIQSAEMVEMMVAAANARALRVAPCLSDPTPGQFAEAKLLLIGAIRRWTEAGAGSFQQQVAGPFTAITDTRQRGGFNLWPSEITNLQEICSTGPTGREAFSLDTANPRGGVIHADICSLVFGSLHCSCGADIAGYPLYEVTD